MNEKIISYILFLLLVISLSWIIHDKYVEKIQQENFKGYQLALVNIYKSSLNCNIIPLIINNQTINLVDVGCLQQK